MQRRTRNRICIWLIFAGLINFVAYTLVYAKLGGDAKNGGTQRVIGTDGSVNTLYYIKGHFIRGPVGQRRDVPKSVWIYSYLHSISIWPTQGVLMICMLILAQPHIIATMREGDWIRGPTFVAVAITLVAAFYVAMTAWFVIGFVSDL